MKTKSESDKLIIVYSNERAKSIKRAASRIGVNKSTPGGMCSRGAQASGRASPTTSRRGSEPNAPPRRASQTRPPTSPSTEPRQCPCESHAWLLERPRPRLRPTVAARIRRGASGRGDRAAHATDAESRPTGWPPNTGETHRLRRPVHN